MRIVALAAVAGCDSKLATKPEMDLVRRDVSTPPQAQEDHQAAAADGPEEAGEGAPADDKLANEKAKAIALAEQAKLDRQLVVVQLERKQAEKRASEVQPQPEDGKQEAAAREAEMARQTAEAKAREEAQRTAEAAAVRKTTAVFYDALSQHGEWFESDLYGYVWRPRSAVTQPGWRPYADGRWRWTDYAWTWQSNEPFGWAVYHFGRWAKLPGTGWVWVPGYEWASAWVAWRFTREAVGWAPLPPEAYSPTGFNGAVDVYCGIGPAAYGFIHITDFDAPSYRDKFLPPERQIPVIEASVNLTSIRYTRSGERMILACGGPSAAHISSVLVGGREKNEDRAIKRMSVELMDSLPEGAAMDAVNFDTLILHAPQLERSPAPGKPQALAGKLEIRSVERGWTQENASRDEIWRERIKVEARALEAREKSTPARPEEKFSAPVVQVPPRLPPRPIARPAAVAKPAPDRLKPAQLAPSGGLFPKRP